MRRPFPWLPTVLIGLLPLLALAEGDAPYPAGRSIQKIEGLKTVLVVPEIKPADRAFSLVVALHPAAGPASNMADVFEAWLEQGYVVCAPQAKDLTWEVGDLQAVIRIIPHLVEVLAIDPARIHLVGYSDGGTHLDRVAFDDAVKPCSATWVAATYTGNRVPRWARAELGALALLGAKDPEIRRLRDGMDRLHGKVQSVEVRTAANVGDRFPFDERPYLLWWMGIQEKRIEPGRDLGFEWTEDLGAAVASQADAKKGGVLVWVYGADDVDKPTALTLQTEVLLDETVRFFGRQLACVRLDRAKSKAVLEPLGVTASPALILLDKEGSVVKSFTEAFSARKVAAAMKKLVPNRRAPR